MEHDKYRLFSSFMGDQIRAAFQAFAEMLSEEEDMRMNTGSTFADYIEDEEQDVYEHMSRGNPEPAPFEYEDEDEMHTANGTPTDMNGMIKRPSMRQPFRENVETDQYYQGAPLSIPQSEAIYTRKSQGGLLPIKKG